MRPTRGVRMPRAVGVSAAPRLQTSRRVCGASPPARGTASAVTDSDLVSYLRHPARDQEVFLVGTVHISNRSARLVREVIASVKPDVVMVELCEARRRKLTAMARGEQETVLDSILRNAGVSRELASQYLGQGILKSMDTYFRGNEMLAGCALVSPLSIWALFFGGHPFLLAVLASCLGGTRTWLVRLR